MFSANLKWVEAKQCLYVLRQLGRTGILTLNMLQELDGSASGLSLVTLHTCWCNIQVSWQRPPAGTAVAVWRCTPTHPEPLGMSLRNVSYEAFVSNVFSRNRGKTKPLIWWSVSSILPSQAAPNLTAS